MQVKKKTENLIQPKKTFAWNISSETVSFMQANDLRAARDGCGNCGDCSNVSPTPEPKKKRHQKTLQSS